MRASEEFGPYVVYEQIGLGGMATVHRAETQGIAGFSKQVALKRMLPSVASDANLVKSFIREARLASHLRHANVAQTYDLGKVGDTYFIAMELVPGRSLLAVLKHCAASGVHMPLAIAMNIVNQIADALDYAHNLCDETGAPLGIIHRDVSPANVIVSEGGIVKLIDFGIAKASGGGMQTMSGTVKGKFSYMAPECLMGHVDARSDLFAIGVIAHELLANRPLFQGKDDMDTLYRVKDMPVLPPSRINPLVPPEIEAIIMTALERDPEKRWQRATAMRQALTTETQRLGLIAQNMQVSDWLTRVFAAPVHEEEEPSIVVSRHTVELAQGTVPEDFSQADSLETVVKPSGSKPLQAQSSEWKVATDVSTIDVQPAMLGESTLTDAPPVFEKPTLAARPINVFERETVAAPVNSQIANDWNAPSSVETQNERPRLDEWAPRSGDETREVKQSELDQHIVRSRSNNPHVIQRSTGANAPLRSPSQPPPARATPPQMQAARDTSPQQTFAQDSSPTMPQSIEASARPSLPAQSGNRPSSPPYAPYDGRASSPQLPNKVSSSPPYASSPQSQSGNRPSSPPYAVQPSSQQPAQAKRPSAPPQNAPQHIPPSGGRTLPQMPQQLPPIGVPMSGSRTLPGLAKQDDDLEARTTEINVGKTPVLEASEVGAILDDLDERSSVIPLASTSAGKTRAELPSRLAPGNFLLALLVLIAAGGAAAVVYFALPYLT